MSIIGRIAILFVALIATPAASAATVWHVAAGAPGPGTLPNSYPTIQAALDAASSGDQIIVTPGVYFEHLDFLGKDVLLRSSAGPDVTIVDAGGPVSVSVVTFAHGEGPAAVLRGFTLRHGDGTGSWPQHDGGGIYCKDASPTIDGNVIEQCSSGDYGGGLVLYGGAPVVSGNTVRDNHVSGRGGGIYCAAGTTARIVGNTIRTNHAAGTGGGVFVDDTATPTIEGNLVEENVAGTAAGIGVEPESTQLVVVRGNVIRGNRTDDDWFGGLMAGRGTLVEDNDIIDNWAYGLGSGVWALGSTLRNNRITGNHGYYGAAVMGIEGTTFDGDLIEDNAGVAIEGPTDGPPARLTRVTITGTINVYDSIFYTSGQVVLEDCLITGNAEGVKVSGSTTLKRCTLADNEGSAVMAVYGGHATLEGCIAWGNALATGLELTAEPGSSLDASWSIVRLGYPGTGNLDLDPLFADAPAGDYALLPGSPAIDSGNPAESVCGFDLTGMPRRLDGLLDGGSHVDRGALEFGNGRLSHAFPLDGVLEIELQGTAGLPAALLAGLVPGQACLEKWGTLGIDLAAPSLVLPWPGAPSVVQAPVPASLSGLTVVLQALVASPGFKAGNLTNVAAVPMP